MWITQKSLSIRAPRQPAATHDLLTLSAPRYQRTDPVRREIRATGVGK